MKSRILSSCLKSLESIKIGGLQNPALLNAVGRFATVKKRSSQFPDSSSASTSPLKISHHLHNLRSLNSVRLDCLQSTAPVNNRCVRSFQSLRNWNVAVPSPSSPSKSTSLVSFRGFQVLRLIKNALNCFLCQEQINGGLDELSSHFRRSHGIVLREGVPGTGFICGQDGCQRSFNHFSSLRRHINNEHLEPLHDIYQGRDIPQMIPNDPPGDRMEVDEAIAGNVPNLAQIPEQPQRNVDLTPNVVRMIARFQAHGSMTGATMTRILNESEDLMLNVQDNIQARVNAHLRPGQVIDQETIRRINEAIHFNSPFVGLKSLPQQMRALTNYCNYIESQGIFLGYRLDSIFDRDTCTYVPDLVLESYQYVPIIQVLEMVLSNREVREAIESEEPSEAGVYGSFLDGAHYAQHPFLQIYRRAIRLKIYLDDVEIVGPLGSKTGIHKLTIFYVQVDNLPAHMNSELSSIHVLLIANSEDVKKYGYGKILAPFLDDLAKLESDEGVQITIDGEIYVLRATVIALCGDGLAIHEVYNHLSPSANQFCRMCMYSREDLLNGSLERAPARTRELYEEHYNLLEETNFSAETMTLTGLRGRPHFESRYFDISKNKLFDLMHEFLEGVCPMTIKAVLHRYIVMDKRFTVKYLNEQIHSFDYGYVEHKNKPSANFTIQMLTREGHGLSQKAAQMWLLVRAFPFLLAEKIDIENDIYMEQVLQLLRIMEIVFAPRIPTSMTTYLEAITDDFNASFRENFPYINWINRLHQIGHLAECIEFCGSLIEFYCMRFEAKHAEVKLRAQNVHNFINPPKTLIRVFQCVQSSVWGAGDVELHRIKAPSGQFKMVGSLLSRAHLGNLGFVREDEVFVPNTVVVDGTEYRKGLIVVLQKASSRADKLPSFGRIEEIIFLQAARKRAFFLTSVCTTVAQDPSLNAYRIKLNNVMDHNEFVEATDLATYKPYCTWKKPTSDSLYVSLRNIIE